MKATDLNGPGMPDKLELKARLGRAKEEIEALRKQVAELKLQRSACDKAAHELAAALCKLDLCDYDRDDVMELVVHWRLQWDEATKERTK